MPLKRELGPFWSQTLCVDAVDAPLSPESTIETTEIPPSTELDLLVLLAPQSTLHPAPEPVRFLIEKKHKRLEHRIRTRM